MELLLQAMHMSYRADSGGWWSRSERPRRQAVLPAKAITKRVRRQSKLRLTAARA